jgi:CelD/BcsL family acetyltransferase involved in cellulose biosynthesis
VTEPFLDRRPSVSVEARDAIAPIAAEWDALARQASASPFLWPGWFEAWLAAFAPGPPLVLTAWRARLAGVLIVRRRAGALLSLTNAHTPAFGMVADDPAVARALAHALFASAAAGAGHAFVQRTLRCSPYATLRPGDLRRFERRLRALGRVELQVADGREELDALLAEGFRLESSGWKAARGTAIASSPVTRRFYSDVARWAAAGILRLAFLRVDGRGVAFHFALQDASAYYLLKCGYAPEAGHCASGRLLARAMLARALAGGLERFELPGADDPWKREWAREHRASVRVRAFRPTLLGKLDRALQTTVLYGRPLAKRTLARVR